MKLPLYAVSIFPHSTRGPFVLALLPLVIFLLVLLAGSTISRRRREVFPQTANPAASGREDSRYWIAGVIYANPNDPALLVKKRFGLGRTLNFGHWAAWLIMAGLLSIPFLARFMSAHR